MAVQEFLSSNKNRAYPFVENSTLGKLPTWILLEFRLINCASTERGRVFCTHFTVNDENVTLSFEYTSGGTAVPFSIPVVMGSDVVIGTVNAENDVVVKFAVYGGGKEYVLDVQNGEYEVGAEVLPSRIIEISRESVVRSFAGVSGSIHVVDGHNTTARTTDNTIHISIGNSAGLGADCDVPEDAFDCKKALLFINGQHADTSGNINIVGGIGVVVQTGRNAQVGGAVVPAITIRHDGSLKGTT